MRNNHPNRTQYNPAQPYLQNPFTLRHRLRPTSISRAQTSLSKIRPSLVLWARAAGKEQRGPGSFARAGKAQPCSTAAPPALLLRLPPLFCTDCRRLPFSSLQLMVLAGLCHSRPDPLLLMACGVWLLGFFKGLGKKTQKTKPNSLAGFLPFARALSCPVWMC